MKKYRVVRYLEPIEIEVEAEDEENANWVAWEDISTSDLETDYVEIEEIEE
jgi:hypothetical protein